MSASRELTVPDIGDFKDVPVIEVLVKPGDVIAKDAAILTLESDKATLDVPSDVAGTIKEIRVKVGDRVSHGTVYAIVESADAPAANAAKPAPAAAAQSQAPAPAPAPAQAATGAEQVRDLIIPDIGDFKDVPIIEILIKVGDTITKDAALITLESDKATLDVPAPFSGTIREIKVKVGERISAGTVFATAATGAPAAAPQPVAAAAAPAGASVSVPVVSGSNGSSSNGSSNNGSNGSSNGYSTVHAPAAAPSGPVHASPSIRRFARELGVDLAKIHGTGPNGRITREDVQGWVKRALSQPSAAMGGQSGGGMSVAAWPKVDFASFGPVERVPLSRIKKISGPALHRNWVTIPHVTQNDEADITDLEAMRKAINAEQEVKVTMLAFMIVASVAALKKFPDVNSSLDGDDLVKKNYYNIGFAADTPNGLVVPVIRNADQKGVLELAKEMSVLAKKAREGKLSGAEMQGGTFTISSLGGIGGTSFTPIINAPEVAILGVTKSVIKPVWDGKAFQPRLMLPLSFSYDHRVIDGAGAARFVVSLAQTLADLRRALL